MATCSIKGCGRGPYVKGMCSRHYQQVLNNKPITFPKGSLNTRPKVAPKKKRCHARMKDGSRCIRQIYRAGVCDAHHRELADAKLCGRYDHEINLPVREPFVFEGREDELGA